MNPIQNIRELQTEIGSNAELEQAYQENPVKRDLGIGGIIGSFPEK